MSGALMGMAVVTGIFGLIMLVWPAATVRVAAILFGIWLMFSGLVMLAQAVASSGNGLLRALVGVGGLLSMIIGAIAIFNGDASVKILVIFVLIGWLANGLAYVIVGLRDKYSPNRGGYLVFGGIQLLLALLVIAWPSATVTVIVRVIGIGLLMLAALQVWIARRVRANAGQGPIVVSGQ